MPRQLSIYERIEAIRTGPTKGRVRVILFRRSGKYYTEEEWRLPDEVNDRSHDGIDYTRPPILPSDMDQSVDFRRIDGGPVLVESQEPWGHPWIFPGKPETLSNDELVQTCLTVAAGFSERREQTKPHANTGDWHRYAVEEELALQRALIWSVRQLTDAVRELKS